MNHELSAIHDHLPDGVRDDRSDHHSTVKMTRRQTKQAGIRSSLLKRLKRMAQYNPILAARRRYLQQGKQDTQFFRDQLIKLAKDQ